MVSERYYNMLRKWMPVLERWQLKFIYNLYGLTGVSHAIQNMRHPLPFLKMYGAQIGDGTLVYSGIKIHAAEKDYSKLRVGNGARIISNVLLDLTDTIDIGDKAVISFGCNLITHRNIANSPLTNYGYKPVHAPITIGNGAVLFANTTVLMGVTVGECAMVAAGAVVTCDVPPWTLVGGVPARILKHLK